MAKRKFSLIIKAVDIEAARQHIDDWLSEPMEQATSLGYGEVMAEVVIDNDDYEVEGDLTYWRDKTTPALGEPYPQGALLSWTE